MAVSTLHHWPDPVAGLEMRRVARRVVVFAGDTSDPGRFWLTRDYLPEFSASRACRVLASLTEMARVIGARMEPVPIPWDCADGFFEAYWRLPEDTWTRVSAAAYRSGPQPGRTPSRGRCAASAMTSPQAGGPNATAILPVSTMRSLAFACLSPEPGPRESAGLGGSGR